MPRKDYEVKIMRVNRLPRCLKFSKFLKDRGSEMTMFTFEKRINGKQTLSAFTRIGPAHYSVYDKHCIIL